MKVIESNRSNSRNNSYIDNEGKYNINNVVMIVTT